MWVAWWWLGSPGRNRAEWRVKLTEFGAGRALDKPHIPAWQTIAERPVDEVT